MGTPVNKVWRIGNPENSEHFFTSDGRHAALAEKNGYEVTVFVQESQKPVAYTEMCEITNMRATGLYLRGFPESSHGRDIALYSAPQPIAPDLPQEMTPEMMRAVQLNSELGAYTTANLTGAYGLFAEFWRVACRAAVLKKPE